MNVNNQHNILFDQNQTLAGGQRYVWRSVAFVAQLEQQRVATLNPMRKLNIIYTYKTFQKACESK